MRATGGERIEMDRTPCGKIPRSPACGICARLRGIFKGQTFAMDCKKNAVCPIARVLFHFRRNKMCRYFQTALAIIFYGSWMQGRLDDLEGCFGNIVKAAGVTGFLKFHALFAVNGLQQLVGRFLRQPLCRTINRLPSPNWCRRPYLPTRGPSPWAHRATRPRAFFL